MKRASTSGRDYEVRGAERSRFRRAHQCRRAGRRDRHVNRFHGKDGRKAALAQTAAPRPCGNRARSRATPSFSPPRRHHSSSQADIYADGARTAVTALPRARIAAETERATNKAVVTSCKRTGSPGHLKRFVQYGIPTSPGPRQTILHGAASAHRRASSSARTSAVQFFRRCVSHGFSYDNVVTRRPRRGRINMGVNRPDAIIKTPTRTRPRRKGAPRLCRLFRASGLPREPRHRATDRGRRL